MGKQIVALQATMERTPAACAQASARIMDHTHCPFRFMKAQGSTGKKHERRPTQELQEDIDRADRRKQRPRKAAEKI